MSFPVPAGDRAKDVAAKILDELRNDPRVERRAEPKAHVSKVIDVANPVAPVVELTVSAKVNPADTDVVKQQLLDRAGVLIAAA